MPTYPLSYLITTMLVCSIATATTERCGLWVDLYTGEPTSLEAIVDDLQTVDVIFLGESHRVDRHHQFQEQIISMLDERGKNIVLGIEQMEAIYQPSLDQYNAGELTFEELAEATNWSERWKNYRDYKPSLEAARASGGSVVALNAPLESIRTIGRQGMDSLTEEQQATLATEWSFEDPLYRRWMDQLMLVHMTFSEEMLERVFHAQVMRDETMAENMTRAMQESHENSNRIGVVLTGSGHCSYGLGIPARMIRRNPELRERIVLMSESGDTELTEAEKEMKRDISITHEDLRFLARPIADYLHVIEPKDSE